MRILEQRVGRRAFLVKALYAALGLSGYGTGCTAGGMPATGGGRCPADGIVMRVPKSVAWARAGTGTVIVTGSLPAGLVDRGMPRGLVLCAVEANRQAPYCAVVTGTGAGAAKKPVREGGSVRFDLGVDIVAVLGLPGQEATYFVHASCGQYRSAVAALMVVKGT